MASNFKMKLKDVQLFVVIFILNVVRKVPGAVIVSTSSGDIAGHTLDIRGHNAVGSQVTSLNIFLGIPYAEPPVGKLRYARPVPKRSWFPKRLEAFSFAPACPQPLWFLQTYSFPVNYTNIDEDCLYLNIYAPHIFWSRYASISTQSYPSGLYFEEPVVTLVRQNNRPRVASPYLAYLTAKPRVKMEDLTQDFQSSENPDLKYPVLFWIHGGAYKYGSGAEYDGRILAQEGVVVVTINYRVGVMGFLSTDDDVAPGNYGLLDQLMALKWIKENVISFHGDPERITIFGQSAGGASVSLHMFSPLAKGLFNSMIPQSGSALSPWAIYRPPHKIQTYTKSLARSVGCTISTSSDMVSCLRSKDTNLLVNTKVGKPAMISTFAPRVDGYYIHDLPEVLLQRGDYLHNINVLNGYLPNEVSEDYESVPGIDHGLSRPHLEQLFYTKSRRYLANADDIYSALKCAYPPSNSDKAINRDHLINMNSDYEYVVPHIKLSEKLSANGENVWLYQFTYRSPGSLKKQWIGVPHAEELYYLFGAPFFDNTPCPGTRAVTCPVTWGKLQPWSLGDKQVSLRTMKLWADFARLKHNSTLFPSMVGTSQNWPRYSPGEKLLNISSTIKIEHLQRSKGIRFWTSFNYLNLTEPIPEVCHSESEILV